MTRFVKVCLKNLGHFILCYPTLLHMYDHPEEYSEEYRYKMMMQINEWVAKAGHVELQTFGLENLPEEGGYLLCANHQDKFDPCALWLTNPHRLGVVVDDAACHRPVIREYMKMTDGLTVKKGNPHAMLEMIHELEYGLAEGKRYILFPEGKYENDYHTLLPFMNGCFRSAIRANVPIVPAVIVNSYQLFAEEHPYPIRIEVHYLDPVDLSKMENKNLKTVSEMVRQRIQQGLDLYQK